MKRDEKRVKKKVDEVRARKIIESKWYSKYWILKLKFLVRWFGVSSEAKRSQERKDFVKTRQTLEAKGGSRGQQGDRKQILHPLGIQDEIGLFVLRHSPSTTDPCRFININTWPGGARSKQFYSSQSWINPACASSTIAPSIFLLFPFSFAFSLETHF